MLLRSTLIYAPAIIFTRISALLLVIVATRMIDQTEYGLLTLVVAVGEMIDVAVTDWMRISLLRLGGKGDVSRGSLARAASILFGTSALALVVAIPASIIVVPQRWMEFLLAVAAYLVAGAIARFGLIVLQMQQRHTAYVTLEFLRAAFQLVMPVLILMAGHETFLAVSLASSTGTLLAAVVTGIVAARRVVAGPSVFTHYEFFAIGLPVVAVALVSLGLTNGERVILNEFHGAAPVAIFAAVYALARQPIALIANAVNTASFPEAVSRFDHQGPLAAGHFIAQTMALIISLSLPAAALLVALSDDIVRLFLPAEYAGPEVFLFAIIAFAVIATNLSDYVYGAMIHAHKRPHLLIINKAVGSVICIGLSLLLIPSMAEIGAALGLAAGAGAGLFVSIIINQKMTPIPTPWRAMFSAVVVAIGTGYTAALISGSIQVDSLFIKLAIASIASGFVFLAINAIMYPKAVMHRIYTVKEMFTS